MNHRKKSLTTILTLIFLSILLLYGVFFVVAYFTPNIPTGKKNNDEFRSDIQASGTLDGETIYFIYTEAGLKSIGKGKYDMDNNYYLGNSIELSDDEWKSIGTQDNPFTGYFDGNGYEIKGLTLSISDNKMAGLFGYAQNAVFHNITFTDFDTLSTDNPICAVPMDCDISDIFINPSDADSEFDDISMETTTIDNETWYLIETEEQLRAIGTTNTYSLDKNYLQNADIDLSSADWIPIGTSKKPFTGAYDGNGFIIKNLTITDPDLKAISMFPYAYNATLCNIILEDNDIQSAGKNVAAKSMAPITIFAIGSNVYNNKLTNRTK